jgi:hypothetical protein
VGERRRLDPSATTQSHSCGAINRVEVLVDVHFDSIDLKWTSLGSLILCALLKLEGIPVPCSFGWA